MGHIREYYNSILRLDEAEWRFIAAQFERKEFSKNEVMTPGGDIERWLYFVETGLIRFYIPLAENELTFNFCFEKKFTCAYDSFLTQTPSVYAMQALAPTVTWRIAYNDLQKVYKHTQAGNHLGRFAAEQLYLNKSKRELALLQYDATQRYLRLFDEHPELVKRVPVKYLASYIGITPQALSRIRRKLSNKGSLPA